MKGVREGVASATPEVAHDIWAVSGGISVLSFNLTWKMKRRELSMHNYTLFFLFFNILFLKDLYSYCRLSL